MNAIPGVVRGVEETVGSIDDLVIFGSTKEDSDAGIFMRPFTVAIQGFQVEGQFPHMRRFEAACLEFEATRHCKSR